MLDRIHSLDRGQNIHLQRRLRMNKIHCFDKRGKTFMIKENRYAVHVRSVKDSPKILSRYFCSTIPTNTFASVGYKELPTATQTVCLNGERWLR